MSWDSKREYDPSNLEAILNRAKNMSGKTLNEIDIEISGKSTLNKRATGWAGNVIHRWFVDDDNASEPDLPLVLHPTNGHYGLEIKVIPLDTYSEGGNRVKWPQSLAMINFEQIHDSDKPEAIEDSVLFRKDRWTLVIYYRYNAEERPDGEILGVGIWNLEALMYDTIKQDYGTIIQMIRAGESSQLSERLSEILSARTKSSRATDRRSAGKGAPPAKPRVWALKTKYVRKRMELDGVDFNITEDSDLSGRTLQSYILENISGRIVSEVAAKFGKTKLGSKDVARIIATTALHYRPGGLGRRGKSNSRFIDGHYFKVFNVNSRMYPDNSGLRFPHIPLSQLAVEDWEESIVSDLLESILFIPVMKKKDGKLIDGKYMKPIFAKVSDSDLEGIRKEYKIFSELINRGDAKRIFDGKRHHNRLPKASETKYLHMRPCGRDGSITELDSNGNVCTKMALWLNAKFVHSLILDGVKKDSSP